jgi:hypothetical protein
MLRDLNEIKKQPLSVDKELYRNKYIKQAIGHLSRPATFGVCVCEEFMEKLPLITHHTVQKLWAVEVTTY